MSVGELFKKASASELYITSDLQIAALLNYRGHKIVSSELTNDDPKHPNKTNFSFENWAGLQYEIEQFEKNECLVEPRWYMGSIKYIKTIIWNHTQHLRIQK